MSSSRDSSKKQHSGRRVGDFVIDKEIGKGSFAQVYLGWHKVWHITLGSMRFRNPNKTKADISHRPREPLDPMASRRALATTTSPYEAGNMLT
jgi:hypothetical protein